MLWYPVPVGNPERLLILSDEEHAFLLSLVHDFMLSHAKDALVLGLREKLGSAAPITDVAPSKKEVDVPAADPITQA